MIYSLYGTMLLIVYMCGCLGFGWNFGQALGHLVCKIKIPLQMILNIITAFGVILITTYIHVKYY